MKIFILRHGDAEPITAEHTDKHRCLSSKGFEQLHLVSNWMKQHQYHPELILSSPYKRCRQTAETIQQDLSKQQSEEVLIPIEFEDCLIYGSDPLQTLARVMALEVESLLLCSHMPLVSELAHMFAPGAMIMGFRTAELVKIRYDKASQHGVVVANVASNEF